VEEQAVGVVHLRPEVVEAPGRVLAEEEHARQRGEPELRDRPPREEPRLHLDPRLDPREHVEPVGPGDARPVEQRVEDEVLRVLRRRLEPELGERGELLARRLDGVDRDPPRREAVHVVAPERAEVARTEEHDELVPVGLALQRVVHAEARVADVARDAVREVVLPVVEALGVERHRAGDAALDDVHLDAPVVVQAGVEELDLEGQPALAPEGVVRPEPDVAPAVVGDGAGPLEHPGRDLGALAVGRGRQGLGPGGDVGELEGRRRRGDEREGAEEHAGDSHGTAWERTRRPRSSGRDAGPGPRHPPRLAIHPPKEAP
jgi:hypothetical protein